MKYYKWLLFLTCFTVRSFGLGFEFSCVTSIPRQDFRPQVYLGQKCKQEYPMRADNQINTGSQRL